MQNSEIFERYVKYDFYRNNYREFANIINKLLKNNEGNYDWTFPHFLNGKNG